MKKTVQTIMGVMAAISACAQTIVYQQHFESGLKPPEFTPWHFNMAFPSMWNYQPAIDGKYSLCIQEGVPGFDIATFCALPQSLNTLTVNISFHCNDFPDDYGIEVIDLYDQAGNEVFDVYLDTTGQLSFTVGGSIASISKPIPVNKPVRLSLHYDNASSPAVATLTWAQPNGVFGGEINGAYRNDIAYTSAVSQFLLGPVESPIVFVYDDITVTTP